MKKLLLLFASGMIALTAVCETKTDILKVSDASFAGSSSYQNFTLTTTTSGAEYAGNALSTNSDNFQFNKTSSGIYVTKSAGTLVSVKYVFDASRTAPTKGLTLYASNAVYSSLPSSGEIQTGISSTNTYTFNNDGYIAFALKGGGNAAYLSQIEVTWDVPSSSSDDLGEIIVKYGDVVIENQYENSTVTPIDIPVGTELSVSSTNATLIQIQTTSYTPVESSTATFSLNDLGETSVTIVSSRYDQDPQTKTFYFVANVFKPEAGDIVGTYGADNTPIAADDEISVAQGTEFTFTSANATKIGIEAMDENSVVYELASADGETVTWTADRLMDRWFISVTSKLGEENGKTMDFTLTVTEPVEPEHEIWTLVTSVDDLVEGGKYIIANNEGTYGMSNTNEGNYRPATMVTVTEKNLLDPSDAVLRLTLEKDGEDYLWKTINYTNTAGEILADDKQVYLNASSGSSSNTLYATNPQSGNENRRNTSVTFEEEGNVLITFVNVQYSDTENRRIFYNGSTNPTRFSTYKETHKSMGKVKLYKLLEPEMPVFDQIEDDASIVSVKSTKGDLHVWTLEYDKDGNLVKDNGEDVTASVLAKAPAADDNTWTNRVADENVAYNIDVPTTEGNYLTIRAKSVLNGIHSDELVKYVDASGNVISGIEAVAADDTNAPVEYFNLQGMRVNADQPGLYIRRQGSKVEKVSIR